MCVYQLSVKLGDPVSVCRNEINWDSEFPGLPQGSVFRLAIYTRYRARQKESKVAVRSYLVRASIGTVKAVL